MVCALRPLQAMIANLLLLPSLRYSAYTRPLPYLAARWLLAASGE
jgi:hypothetical protein